MERQIIDITNIDDPSDLDSNFTNIEQENVTSDTTSPPKHGKLEFQYDIKLAEFIFSHKTLSDIVSYLEKLQGKELEDSVKLAKESLIQSKKNVSESDDNQKEQVKFY